MSDYDDDFMADDEDYDLEYSEDSNSGKQSFQCVSRQPFSLQQCFGSALVSIWNRIQHFTSMRMRTQIQRAKSMRIRIRALQLDFLHLCVIFSRTEKLSYIFVVLLIPDPDSCA
jgi:hypothetical protein